MVRRSKVALFPMPAPLFPITRPITSAVEMIPVVADPTGRGARAWEILSRLPITEGEHAGKRIAENSPPWQEPLTRLIFGHTDEQGQRVLREVFIGIGKKNGKTAYASALALTKLLLDEEMREQAVFLAANRLQARIAFDSMAAMIHADEVLGERFEVVEGRHTIRYLPTHSQARALSVEMASIVGAGPTFAVVDELHLLGATPKGAKLVNQIRTGGVARREPLLISISTAPVARSEGVFASTLAKARRVISGQEIDPRFFGLICEIPPALDPEDSQNWHWSNPSLGFTVTADRLKALSDSAQSDPATLRDFQSQNLNIQPDASIGEGRWLSLAEWDAASDDTVSLEAVLEEAKSIFVGIDAGGLDDLSAFAVLGRTKDDRFLLWSHQWLSRRGYEKRMRFAPYDDFISAGELSLFEDGGGDIEAMARIVKTIAGTGKLRQVGIDSYGAPALDEALKPAPVATVPQGWKLTPAITWVERRLADGALRHSGATLLRWNVGNVVVTRQGNASSVNKSAVVGTGKIDGVAALLNASAACLSAPPEREYQLLFV